MSAIIIASTERLQSGS